MPTPNPMKEKAHELRQKRSLAVDENRVLAEKMVKESRALTADEQTQFDGNETRAFDFAKQISTIERQLAIDGIESDPSKRNSGPLPHEDPDNAGKHTYSILRAVKCLAEKRAIDGLEGETSQELAKRTNKSPQGFFMPMGQGRRQLAGRNTERRALDSTTGAGSVPTILDTEWIQLLRNAMQVMAAGATEILDLQGKFAIPRQSASATAYWVGESGAPTGSNQTLDQVPFTPHTIGAYTDISRRFFELTNITSGEEFVKSDLTAILARGIDLAALSGTGASNQPLGLTQNPAVTTNRIVSLGTNGGVPTFSALVELATIVNRSNAGTLGSGCYLGNADVEGTLSTTAKIGSTFPVFLLENGKVNGRDFLPTQQLPNNLTKGSGTALSSIVYGIWNQLVLAYWSGVDILVDPYTGSSTGTVRVVALQDMDIQTRHNEAFSFIFDMVSNQTQ